MSNLNSLFDTLRGWPNGSALDYSFMPKAATTLAEGTVVKTADSGDPLKCHVEALSSGEKDTTLKDEAWMVIQGNDQWDAAFAGKVAAVKLGTGVMLRVPTLIANTLVPGEYVHAVAGVLTHAAAGAGMKWVVGQVVYSNGVTGAGGYVDIVS